MIGNKENFFTAHYDYLVLGFGIVALIAAGVVFAMSLGVDADEEAAASARQIERMKPSESGVKAVDLGAFNATVSATKSPALVASIDEKKASFLASERRVKCGKCKKAICGDVKACPKCPFCGELQEQPVEVVLDADGDGMPDEWEKKMGFSPANPADAAADADKDGFTNLEEFTAKTDPNDGKDHPDYLDSLTITLPLKETYMPFVFRKATKIPNGYRCEFLDPSRKNDYGRKGRMVSAKVGEKIVTKDGKEVVDYGFTLKSYTPKSEKRARKGMAGMFVQVDVSEAVVVRDSDKKEVTLVLQEKGVKPLAVDFQATLTYNRNGVKTFEVVPGTELDLNGSKYKVVEVKPDGKGAKVTLEDVLTLKKRTLRAIES